MLCIYVFVGDMGGYMGLLMGASVLTFIEVIDLFLNYMIRRYIRKDPAASSDLEQGQEYDQAHTGMDNVAFSIGLPKSQSSTKL